MINKKENISTLNVEMGGIKNINAIDDNTKEGGIDNTIGDNEKRGENISTFIGIDVGKYFIDVYCSLNNKYYLHIPNDRSSIKSLINDLKKIKGFNPLNTLVVIDLTGNYEVLCGDMFHNNGFTNIHLADGKKINHFKKSKKHNIAKTDKTDSYILSLYGKENLNSLRLYETNINAKDLSNLKAVENRLEELKQILVQEKNRLQAPSLGNSTKKDIGLSLKQLERRIDKLEEESLLVINNNRELKEKYDILINQKGISSITAKILIAFLPELGTVNKRQISSISGTAPVCKDSGTLKGYRSAKGTGRHIIKKSLFIVMLTHIRDKNSILNKFYNKLLKKGKPKKVAIIACMRKFIIYLNSLLKKSIKNNPEINEVIGNDAMETMETIETIETIKTSETKAPDGISTPPSEGRKGSNDKSHRPNKSSATKTVGIVAYLGQTQ